MPSTTPGTESRPYDIDVLLSNFAQQGLTSPATDVRRAMAEAEENRTYLENMAELGEIHARALGDTMSGFVSRGIENGLKLAPSLMGVQPGDAVDYAVDLAQRSALFIDTLRRRGNQFVNHEEQGCPPVLAYDYDMIIDGETLERPVNYALVRIRPPDGVATREDGRPYIVIDPRAGHGSGIGGFKHESEVGVALADGHPTYFVIFRTHPTKSQTIADIARAEAHFVREVRRRHPDAPKPVVVGNCQGGWGAMVMAATNPDITGPVVINGAPLSYWAGLRGKNPLRYMGGVTGGVVPALIAADLGNGEFDGANLVLNFESLSPANTWWHKYYDVFANSETETERYLQFERWWSGFYFMNENEIRWIIDNLFVGNRLASGGARLDARTHVDLRHIRAPIIVFASHGDNITPVPQALNWIAEAYASVQEIKARGQRIVYTVHENIGHLGIFVASSVANKQHKEIVSTLKTIESMAPGLYEMKILDAKGEGRSRTYEVAFEERDIDDIRAFSDQRPGEGPFRAMARISELNAELYNLTLRPWLRMMVSPATAKMASDAHPLRSRRYLFSDRNPFLTQVAPLADQVRRQRHPAAADNPFLLAEKTMAGFIGDCWDVYRDWRDAWTETFVLGLYGSPLMRNVAAKDEYASLPPPDDLRQAPDVHDALESLSHGGFVEATIRMLVLLAHSRGGVRRDRLERSNEILTATEPFASLGELRRSRIIHQQSIIVDFEPEEAVTTLPLLLLHAEDRRRALEICEFIAGAKDEMEPPTVAMFARLRAVLGLEEHPSAPNGAGAEETLPGKAAPRARKRQQV